MGYYDAEGRYRRSSRSRSLDWRRPARGASPGKGGRRSPSPGKGRRRSPSPKGKGGDWGRRRKKGVEGGRRGHLRGVFLSYVLNV